MRAMICATLEALGDFDIFEAANGFEALRLLPRESFDLVITDINMPDINGLELVSFIKRNDQYKTIPLVIVSTEGSERDREKGLKLGANAYLVKPFSPEELQKLVEKFLE
ncbi:response regulator [Geoalkalibacter halelectricus]|uniref:Response regulator n=2 Tax=Geoalkalibacter halelectricus TaxID=2847045 RepID=A0ABY5ZS91_9BACT|nr:response regulator [Geoalkalibacter halelectricus]UWZ81551.1 response regulator [Geoalkalibacter halelectricus]